MLRSLVSEVKEAELRAALTKLVGFGTRHTLSDTVSDTRGIGAARRWVQKNFEEISRGCGGCLQIETPEQTVTGNRVPTPTKIVDVLAIQRGTTDPDRVIIIAGHIDSRIADVLDATSDAPGADDDGSGTVAVIEAARVLSKHKFPATLVFAVLSGEEQGLLGGKLLAQYATEHNWQVEADLNNDIIGNTNGANGVVEKSYVRVFSEGTRSTETAEEANRRRYNGGEVDSPSRNLARFISGLADTYLTKFRARMIYRTDRFGRGGDQVPVLAEGYPAVRFTEAIENYTREHQDVRNVNGVQHGDLLEAVDFPYLAQVTRLNVVTMAALAMAPAPPTGVKIDGAVSLDTTVSWSAVPGAASYRVWWRDTTAPLWTNSQAATGTTAKLQNVNIDDWFFGVTAISADGYESPVVFPGPAGSFTKPAAAPAR
ncbi:peptidase M28 [Rhodospirillales bacterium TMPK1]|uniref:Peptidase M28 n=1 Tax=Roseiterribacter gracilis TaxID=2812848 RepID=A0A8S8XJM7_9PROT|nr:peptidase M28 [Rhodospirillales bacterium TMPK1]